MVKGTFFGSTDFNFRKIEFFGPTKQPHFRKSISGSDFHPKQTQPKLTDKFFYGCIRELETLLKNENEAVILKFKFPVYML